MNQVEERSNVVSDFFNSIKNIWLDARIPTRDRWVIAACVFLIISPLDILPDVIPIIGVVDDLILLSFILDYFFNRLDDRVILDHLKNGHKRFFAAKAIIGNVCKISPQHFLHFLWKYKKPTSARANKSNNNEVKNVN